MSAATATDLVKAMTISVDEFFNRAVAGRYTDTTIRKTKAYQALKALEAEAKTPAPPPTPPPAAALEPYHRIAFQAQNPLDALAAPPSWRVAFTADPGYDQWATKGAADSCRAAGHDVYVWYVPTEVSKARADEVAGRLGATLILGQCETADQFDVSMAHGRKAMVGNLGSLNPAQLARVASGECIVVNEDYWGCGGGPPDWHNANKGVPGNCVAVYEDGQCQRKSVAEYIAAGRFNKATDSVYGPGMLPVDWAALH